MRRSFFALLFAIFFSLTLLTAQENPVIMKNGLALKYLTVDHRTPLDGLSANLFKSATSGVELDYIRGFNQNLHLAIPIKFGSAEFPLTKTTVDSPRKFLAVDALIHYHPLGAKYIMSPYLLGGIGAMGPATDEITAQIPLGLGLNFRLTRGFYIQLQSEYRIALSDLGDNLQYGGGIFINLSELRKNAKDQLPTDTDGDGVADVNDKCPTVPGLAIFSGCPDTDGDGIEDSKDACPNEKGTVANNGCPVRDTDGDGVPDDVDDCPNAPGPASANGCPDTDGDGLADNIDRCPTTPGPAGNKGCPEVKDEIKEELRYVGQSVQFETGRATLKPESFAILDKVVVILNQYPDYNLAISGHTDSVGDAETNQLLSERRAKSCYDYLVSKRIPASRMTYVGYGETRPIGDNRYMDGRELNRRVEFDLFLK